MDSLTQAALGAVVGQAVMGRRVGRVAPMFGAVLGTLPDLDVLIAFGGAVEDFVYHRGFSHSLLVHLLVTPLLAWLILRFHAPSRQYKVQWAFAVLAILWTHALLDAFTVYGTQLLWPLTDYPFGISSVFIIDPFYTVPLLLAFKAGWSTEKANRTVTLALLVSTAYLGWSVIAKEWLHEKIDQALVMQSIEADAILSVPSPFNTLLWRVIVLQEEDYKVGHATLWDSPEDIDFKSYPKGEMLLKGIESEWDVQRLAAFTKGFYRVALREDQIVITDLRMGYEGSYVFNFSVGQAGVDGTVIAHKAMPVRDKRDVAKLALIWHRLWDKRVSLHLEDVVIEDAAPCEGLC